MKIKEIISLLEQLAPPAYAEEYDNVGLLVGNAQNEVTGVLCTLDCIENVIDEAVLHKCNLIIAHHPIIFKGLKKLTGSNYVERTVMKAIKHDISIYAIHTNLDHVSDGVNKIICDKIGLNGTKVLKPKANILLKLAVFVPNADVEKIRNVLFLNGAGNIGNYSECDFELEGTGGYMANENANPVLGEKNIRHTENETRVEVIMPIYLKNKIVSAMIKAHPYEEVAYDVYELKNVNATVGSGMVGEFEKPMDIDIFKSQIKKAFGLGVIRHTQFLKDKIQRVAVCGGSGSFLLKDAISAGADVFITADFKYHEFFDSENQIVIMDIGHFESEQFTPHLLADYLKGHIKNIATFAVRLSEVETNPVKYF
jgi:dinuclear metal center YbgI/SA1388 family protein